MRKKQQKHKEKQEQFINNQSVALENQPIDIHDPHQFKINLFISNQQIDTQHITDNIIQSQRAQLTTPCESTTPQSQPQGKKRKYSQKSDNYHRVGHSRKIKTRKVVKQHLQRSEYFYYDSLTQQNDQSPINQLLNQYEAFQQLAALAYEKKVIKLSHYGRKSSQYSNSNSEKKRFTDREDRVKHSQIVEFSLHNQSQNVRALSKSLIGWDIKSRVLTESRVIQCHRQRRESMGKQQIRINELDKRLNIKLGQQHQLTKYTTPIRTIYLNHPQQSPLHLNQSPHNPSNGKPPKHNTLQSSPNQHQRLSIFTPLISQRIHKNQPLKPFKSIIVEPLQKLIKEEQQSVHLETRSSCQINKSYEHNDNNNKLLHQNSKLGLSVVGRRKQFQIAKVEKSEAGKVQDGKAIQKEPNQQILITHQISLPNEYQLHRNRYLMNQPQHQNHNKLKNSSTTHLNHSHSHSRSRKGLSLTQSATNIRSLNRPKVNSVASIAEFKQRDEKKNDPLARKLNASCVYHPKRVEIRIY